ncbi:MAG: amidohydrolase family protein, partial [Sciscionella sp.]
LDRTAFEEMLSEADTVSPLGVTLFDSMIGLAVRRWCAPILDLPAHAAPQEYLARRCELGVDEVSRRFLRATGTEEFLVDGGFRAGELTSSAELGALAGASAHDIVRLELVAEDVVLAGTSAEGFAERFRQALVERTVGAIGCKSIAAYRVGLDLSGVRPTDAEVTAAAGEWLSTVEDTGTVRLAHETLHRFLVHCAVDLGLPIQFHVGYGDADLDLHRCDPLLLTGLLRATMPSGVPILLLHNYPFHRNAAYLAQVFEHVFVDVGLATHNVGLRAGTLIAETLELAPFGKFLFSTDAFGLPELYHLGSLLFRRGLSDFLSAGVGQDAWTYADAERIARLVSADNARRVDRLDGQPG